MEENLRYFIVFFTYQNGNDDVVKRLWKYDDYAISSLHYPNKKKVKEIVKEKYPSNQNLSITNVQEVSKKDYENWIAE